MNLKAMQVAETMDDKAKSKVRQYPSDTNIKQMSMASWHASLSRGGQAHPALKGIRQPDRPAKRK